MARPRKEGKEGLPQNLYEVRIGYYAYRDPKTQKSRGLGRDRDAAIRYAERMNDLMGIGPAAPIVPEGFGFAGTLTAEYILGLAKSVKKTCGIYFLMHEREIVYVGQSTNCNFRIGSHLNDELKVFDSYFIVACPESRLDEMEAKYIVKFRPKFNLFIPTIANSIERLYALVERT